MAKRKTPTHRAPADEHAATELVLFIENTSDLSPDGPSGQGRSVLLNALRKWKKGTYDPALAVRLFEYLTEAGAKRYAKEFGTEREWSTMFTPATRHEAAKQLEASFRNSAEHGEYDHIDTRIGREAHEAKAIPYDDTPSPDFDFNTQRNQHWVTLYDDEALKMMQGWTGGQDDLLYAISSSGGANYAWVFEDAIANLDADISKVKKVGRNKFQLGKGTFSKKEIDELSYMRDALQMALDESAHEAQRGGVEAPRVVRDFNTLDDLIAHARDELGATDVYVNDSKPEDTRLYFPRPDRQYESAEVWYKAGYWHAQAPSDRSVIPKLPRTAERIEQFESRRSRRTAEGRSVQAIHGYNIDVFFRSEQSARKFERQLAAIIQAPLVSKGALRDGYRLEYGPIDRDDYRRLEGLIYSKIGNAGNVRLIQNMYAGQEVLATEMHDRPETSWEKWKRAVINDLEREVPRLEATKIFDRYRYEMAVRFRNGEKPSDVAHNFLSVWRNEPPHMRAGRTVKDYEAVDNHNRRIAGPFKSYGDAKQAAGPSGHVKYVRPSEVRAPRRKGLSPTEQAEVTGGEYAGQQIKSEHFDNWVRDQLVEASKMPEDQVLPLETPADARKIAKNMLQQLEWDAKRDPGNAPIPEGEEAAFWRGFHKYCMDSVPWLADEILTLNREIRGAAESRKRPKARRSARAQKRRRRA